jgi:biopolymer transport protein ExbB
MTETMKTEGKRLTSHLWQRLALLNDIAIVAPMLGLLGTVIGMFYAFYDVNRSIESINALFDGLGIAVGTTVAGLIIAILSMLLATTLKYRLVKNLSLVENTALTITAQIEGS